MTQQQEESPSGDPEQRQKMAIEMGISRSAISRLITMARDQGRVRIEVVELANLVNPNSQRLSSEFKLK